MIGLTPSLVDQGEKHPYYQIILAKQEMFIKKHLHISIIWGKTFDNKGVTS
jgi:hypothetical protein